MRLLVLSPFLPFPPDDGGRIRVYHIVTGLALRHDVELLALAPPGRAAAEAAEALRARGIRVHVVVQRPRRLAAALAALPSGRSYYATRFDSPRFHETLRRLIRDRGYDAVQCELPYLFQHHRPGDPPWVLDQHNVEAVLHERLAAQARGLRALPYRVYARREARLRRLEELGACRAADHVLFVSDTDRLTITADVPTLRATVAPNGVDLERFTPLPPRSAPRAVFVGKMDYRPNADGVRWFVRDVLPLVRAAVPEFTLDVVGSSPPRAVRRLARVPGVHVLGRVPDPRPWLRDAAIVVVPLRAGSGTRLKILEAWAAGRPVVSTTVGAEGLDAVHGRHLLLADDAPGFARAVRRLLADPGLRDRLARAGRTLAEERYGWPSIVRAVEEAHAEVQSRRAHTASTGNQSPALALAPAQARSTP